MHAPKWPPRIAVIGAGRLGGALVRGLIGGGLPPDRIEIVQRSAERRAQWRDAGFAVHADARALTDAAVVFVVVKPPDVPGAIEALNASAVRDALVVSFASGARLDDLRLDLRPDLSPARARANVLVDAGRGNLLLSAPPAIEPSCRALLARLGRVFTVDEDRLAAHTWYTSSLPLVVVPTLLREALVGSPPDIDRGLARAAMLGGLGGLVASMEAAADGAPADAPWLEQHLAETVARVATPGGMNDAALGVLRDRGAWRAVAAAERVYRAREGGAAALEKPGAARTVAILTESSSGQASVSTHSAAHIERILRAAGHAVYPVHIDRGPWVAVDGERRLPVDRDAFAVRTAGGPVAFDYACICAHTRVGKGPLQGYLELLGVPFDGASAFASALCDDKHRCKAVLRQGGVAVPDGILLDTAALDAPAALAARVREAVGFPCIVKPDRSGSSLGVSRVMTAEALPAAIAAAAEHDRLVIVEEYVEGREFTLAASRVGGVFESYAILEYPYLGHGLLDHETKFDPRLRRREIATSLDAQSEAACRAIGRAACELLDLDGMLRVDLIRREGAWVCLEVNTLPGLTPESPYPVQVEAAGARFDALVLRLLAAAPPRAAGPRPG